MLSAVMLLLGSPGAVGDGPGEPPPLLFMAGEDAHDSWGLLYPKALPVGPVLDSDGTQITLDLGGPPPPPATPRRPQAVAIVLTSPRGPFRIYRVDATTCPCHPCPPPLCPVGLTTGWRHGSSPPPRRRTRMNTACVTTGALLSVDAPTVGDGHDPHYQDPCLARATRDGPHAHPPHRAAARSLGAQAESCSQRSIHRRCGPPTATRFSTAT